MAGTHISIDDTEVIDALNGLLELSSDLSPALRDIGEMLDNSHDRRFDQQVSPDGTPWSPLSDVTLSRKKRNKDKVLTADGGLRESLHPDVTADTLTFGTNKLYAAVHQFGALQGAFGNNRRGSPIPWGTIPARPFLGFSAADKEEVQRILSRHLKQAYS